MTPHLPATAHLAQREADQWDIDKLVGSVIDAYTLAPNDEDEKREYVKATISNSGWCDRSETLCEAAAMIQAEAVAEDSQADTAVTLQHARWHRARAGWLRRLVERILKL